MLLYMKELDLMTVCLTQWLWVDIIIILGLLVSEREKDFGIIPSSPLTVKILQTAIIAATNKVLQILMRYLQAILLERTK